MKVTAMMTFTTFHFITHRRDNGNEQSKIQVQSASKEAAGAETNAPNVDSDEVSGQMEASSPDEVPTTESPQAIGGETTMEQDSSNQGRPRREINAGPPSEINQVGIPPPVSYIHALPSNQYGMLPTPTAGLTPPTVTMMFWGPNTMPCGISYPAVPQLPQWEVPYQPFQYR